MLGRAGAAPVRAEMAVAARTASQAASASLRVAVVGPTARGAGQGATNTLRLAHQLADAGHDVTLVSCCPEPSPFSSRDGVGQVPRARTALAWNRPDAWLRTGRRLRSYDTVVIVHTGAGMVPSQLALLRAAGVGRSPGPAHSRPRAVLLSDRVLCGRPPARTRTAALLRSVDGVLVHDEEEAQVARRLGASRVYAVPRPDHDSPVGHLSAPWATYLGAIEALAAPQVSATDTSEERNEAGELPSRRAATAQAMTRAVRFGHQAGNAFARSRVELTRAELPEWILATDVLDDGWQAEDARAEARRLGLPRARDGVAAWAALGALAALVRVADDGQHAAVVGDESGSSSPFGRWARACGFAPVDLGLTAPGSGWEELEVDAGSLDVVARVHPGGCDASDVDETVSQAAWALRPGGLLVLTLPLRRPGADGALGPADVRALVARAHDHGFLLVGDLDGHVGRRIRAASVAAGTAPARVPGAAYGLVRLTLRRR